MKRRSSYFISEVDVVEGEGEEMWFGDSRERDSMKFPNSRFGGDRGTCRVRDMS